MVDLDQLTCLDLRLPPPEDVEQANDKAPFFVGELEFWVDCGGTGAVVVTLAATQTANPDWTALLFGQIVTEADFEAMDRVLSTFDIVG